MRKLFLALSVIIVAVSMSSAAQVADFSMTDSVQVVGARKAAMLAISTQAALLQSAVRELDLRAAKDSAMTLAALVGMISPLYADSNLSAYPYPGSRYRFVGDNRDGFFAQVEALYSAAHSASKATIVSDINLSSIFGLCSSCHRSFRR